MVCEIGQEVEDVKRQTVLKLTALFPLLFNKKRITETWQINNKLYKKEGENRTH